MQFIKTNDIEILLKLYPHMKDLCNRLIGGDDVRTALELTESFIQRKEINFLDDSNWINVNKDMIDWVEQYISDESFSETMMLPSDQVVLKPSFVTDWSLDDFNLSLENHFEEEDHDGIRSVISPEEALDIVERAISDNVDGFIENVNNDITDKIQEAIEGKYVLIEEREPTDDTHQERT